MKRRMKRGGKEGVRGVGVCYNSPLILWYNSPFSFDYGVVIPACETLGLCV